jgi:hypothetical protein
MTAVNPTRLRHQIQELIALFDTPIEFHQALRGLFGLHANYSLRFGESAIIRPLIPMYHLPHPVIRQLNFDLQPRIEANPAAALTLADELWTDAYYEIKQTAIFLIGALPSADPQEILDRFTDWLSPDLDQVLKADLLSTGTRSLQDIFPQAWEALVLSLLSKTEPAYNALGIQALVAGAKRPNFQNLPAVFRLASPFIRDPHSAYTRDLEDLIETLIQISPQETGFFLRQTLSVSISPETPRLIKSCLSAFPEEIQADLKAALNKDR